jgi:hypothetical protein
VLVAGWFSYERGGATAGDLIACDVARGWIESAGLECDVAMVFPFSSEVNLQDAKPEDYSQVVFVCGPFGKYPLEKHFLRQFAGRKLIGLNLSMGGYDTFWNPFSVLVERDSSAITRPDIVFASQQPLVPVVGVCLVEPYDGADVPQANAAISRLLASRELAVVPIDTRLDRNRFGLRTSSEVESLFARMDAVVTTRLHGLVLSLKNGIPVVALDPEPAGGKITRQAEAIKWPSTFRVGTATDRDLCDALDYCLTPAGRHNANASRTVAIQAMAAVRDEFTAALHRPIDVPAVTRRRVNRERLTRLARRVASRMLPGRAARFLSRVKTAVVDADWGASRPFGRPRQVTPVSRSWGFDRGTPIDRYYIERFLFRHRHDIRNRVLEIGSSAYTRRFGGRSVSSADVLNVEPDAPGTTIVADLTAADHIPSAAFDCLIVTQTLHLIFDVSAAIRTLYRILKPGGVALVTVPGITRRSTREHPGSWFWAFTTDSARRLFDESFGAGNVAVESHGNVLAASAFLYGLASSELEPAELDWTDPEYQVLVTVRAVRPAGERQ